MTNSNEALIQELEELQRSYVFRLPGKLDQMQAVTRTLHACNNPHEALEILHTYVHNLAGSAGTYECPEVSRAARSYEKLIDLYLENIEALEVGRLDERFKKLQLVVYCTVKDMVAPPPTLGALKGV